MGVAGLWDILRPAGATRSLTHLAVVDGFERNPDGIRGYRVGVDASIWFYHAAYGREGENPELRTLFFRCKTLMAAPFLPLFVFDGPKRPSVKRGKKISRDSHWLTTGMKNIIEAFGFEWRTAPGEAEAELAYLNRIGIIDGILSDDVDTFLFGALEVIRNPSNNLTGNRANPIMNAAGKDDKNHTVVYRSENILEDPDINLTRGGMILIGLMSGGDYHQAGLPGCGIKTAYGLAKCGFGDSLYEAALTHSRQELTAFLETWRKDLVRELRTNSQGHIGRKNAALAKSVQKDFPDIDILLSYTHPITSESEGKASSRLELKWDKEPDIGRLANLCELYFEWGVKPIILKRFRTIIWPSAVIRILRRAVLDAERDNGSVPPSTPKKPRKAEVIGSPSKAVMSRFSALKLHATSSEDEAGARLFVKIHSSRTHVSTDEILEYRLEIDPEPLVLLCEAGVKGIRPPIKQESEWIDDDGDDDDDDQKRKKKKVVGSPLQSLRVWIPASMLRLAEPELVMEYKSAKEKKAASGSRAKKSASKAKSDATRTADISQDLSTAQSSAAKTKAKSVRKKSAPRKKAQAKDHELSSENDDSAISPVNDIKTVFPIMKSVGIRAPSRYKKGKSKVVSRPSATKTTMQNIETQDFSEKEENRVLDSSVVIASGFTSESSQRDFCELDGDNALLPDTKLSDTRSIKSTSAIAKPSNNSYSQLQPFPFTSGPSRKKSQTASESDSDQDQIQKSRKFTQHDSPRAKISSESDKVRSRPVSPSPLPSRTRRVRKSVIEIPSDSDDDVLTTLDVRPLLVARARRKEHSKTSFRDLSDTQEDVIDLT